MDSDSSRLIQGIVIFALGAALGSFLGLVVHRLPRGLSLVRPRSHCDHCHRPLRVLDLIPILGYVSLLGRCASCKSRISPIYPVLEVLSGLTGLLCLWSEPSGLSRAGLFLFLLFLLACAAIDLGWEIIPDALTVPMMAVALAASLGGGGTLLRALSGGAAAGLGLGLIALLYHSLRHRTGLGRGDITLAVAIGLLLGPVGFLGVLVVASVSATSVALILSRTHGYGRFSRLPFAPFLAIGVYLWLFTDALPRLFGIT